MRAGASKPSGCPNLRDEHRLVDTVARVYFDQLSRQRERSPLAASGVRGDLACRLPVVVHRMPVRVALEQSRWQ